MKFISTNHYSGLRVNKNRTESITVWRFLPKTDCTSSLFHHWRISIMKPVLFIFHTFNNKQWLIVRILNHSLLKNDVCILRSFAKCENDLIKIPCGNDSVTLLGSFIEFKSFYVFNLNLTIIHVKEPNFTTLCSRHDLFIFINNGNLHILVTFHFCHYLSL